MRDAFLAFDRRLTGLVWTLAGLLLAIVCLLGLWQVVSRFVLSQPSSWTEEIMRRLLIWSVMLGTVAGFRRGAMISVDLMLRLSSGRWRTVLRMLIASVSIAFLLTVLWFGIDLAWRIRFQTFASIELSMAWAYAALPVGAALGIVAVIAQFLDPVNEELETTQ